MSRRAVIRGALGVAALGVLGTTRRASSRRGVPDYVVVGGGVYGTGLAGELARHGAGVLVLEARRIASGASGGLGQRGVRSNGRQASELPIMKIAQARWRRLRHELGDPRIFTRSGHLHLIESEADLPAAEAQVRLQEVHGVRTRLVDRDELLALEPSLGARVIAAMYSPDDGASDHSVTTHALARAARQRGVRIRRGVSIAEIELETGRAVAVRTSTGERIAVGRDLVLVANAGNARILSASIGLRLALLNVLPQVLVAEPVRSLRIRHVIGHVSRRLAMKALPGGRLMITGGWLGRVNPETGRGETIASEVAGNVAEAVAVYPGLAGVRLRRAVADRSESVAVDLLPVIDRVPGAPNVLVAMAWSGHGWAPAPAYITLMADWLVEGRRPDLLQPFGLARLGIG